MDPSKAGVLMKGSVPPTWSGAFTYASTTSSLTWSWSGLTIFRADGTTTAVPERLGRGHGARRRDHLLFLSLLGRRARPRSAGLRAAQVRPANAQAAKTNAAAQQQALQGRVPLSQGAMVAATTASGTGGGSGGGSGSCLRAGTVVLTKERGTVGSKPARWASICGVRARPRAAKRGRASCAWKCATRTRSSACISRMRNRST